MSIGGAIALDFALTYPQRVTALLLLASGIGGFPQDEATNQIFVPFREAIAAGDFARALEISMRIWVDGPHRRSEEVNVAVRERVRALYTGVLRRSREGNRKNDELQPPAYGRLAEIRTPTLVVVGDGDLPSILDQARLLACQIPKARSVTVPTLAHVLNMEAPELVNGLILAFLAEQLPGD